MLLHGKYKTVILVFYTLEIFAVWQSKILFYGASWPQLSTAQCFCTQSHALMMKILMTYCEPPTTNYRLIWDVESWNFSNNQTDNAFRALWLSFVLVPLFKVSIVNNQRLYTVTNSQLVSNDFPLLKALSCFGLMQW